VDIHYLINSFFVFVFVLQDHIQEVLDKWHQIDDEIWAKLIVMERNRRVAKAYARAIPIQINGSDDGFDGFRYKIQIFLYFSSSSQVEHASSAKLSIPPFCIIVFVCFILFELHAICKRRGNRRAMNEQTIVIRESVERSSAEHS